MSRTFKSISRNGLVLFLFIIFDLIVILLLFLIARRLNIPFGVISKDPGATTEQHFIGILSYLSIMFWAATASTCFITGILLRNFTKMSRFFLSFGILSTILGLDDALMLHDFFLPHFLHIKEWPVYGIYLLILLFCIIYNLDSIMTKTDFPILAIAILFFGVSIFWDVFLETIPSPQLEPIIEDGAKFIGISIWLLYFFLTSIKISQPKIIAVQ